MNSEAMMGTRGLQEFQSLPEGILGRDHAPNQKMKLRQQMKENERDRFDKARTASQRRENSPESEEEEAQKRKM